MCTPTPPVPVPPAYSRLSIVGVGVLCVDLVARVSTFPSPDAKVRSTGFSEHGGGNAANALVAARRLGVPATLVSAVGDDARGEWARAGVAADGVCVEHVEACKGARTPFSYVVAAEDAGTRAIIHTPDGRCGLQRLSRKARAAVEGADVLALDGRHPAAAVEAAEAARGKGAFVLADFEREREGASELLERANGLVVKDAFASAVTGEDAGMGERHLVRLLERGADWVLATRGGGGCVVVRRFETGNKASASGSTDSVVSGLRIRTVRLTDGATEAVYVEAVPNVTVVDATGGGDAFMGSLAYGIATKMPLVSAVVLASVVGARAVAGEGARASPRREEVAVVLAELQSF